MSLIELDYCTERNLRSIGDGLIAIAKAIDKLTEVLKPVEIYKVNSKKEESNNE